MNDNSMSGHLTESQISRWLVEGPADDTEVHLLRCASCKARLEEAQAPLMVFRSAVVDWSEARAVTMPVAIQNLEVRKDRYWESQLWLPAASLAMAAMLLFGFVAESGWLRGHSPAESTATSVSDAALMSQVDSEVSEAVPDALAPLTDLVAWDENESTAGTASVVAAKHPVHKKVIAETRAKAPSAIAD